MPSKILVSHSSMRGDTIMLFEQSSLNFRFALYEDDGCDATDFIYVLNGEKTGYVKITPVVSGSIDLLASMIQQFFGNDAEFHIFESVFIDKPHDFSLQSIKECILRVSSAEILKDEEANFTNLRWNV